MIDKKILKGFSYRYVNKIKIFLFNLLINSLFLSEGNFQRSCLPFEIRWIQIVFFEKIIKVTAVFSSQLRSFADITRPRIIHKLSKGGPGKSLYRLFHFPVIFFYKMTHQKGNVFFSFPQGGEVDGYNKNAIKQVFTEMAFGNLFFQVLVGGSQYPDIDI